MSFTKDYLRVKRECAVWTFFEIAFAIAAVGCLLNHDIALFMADLAMVGVCGLHKGLAKLVLIVKYKEDK